MGGGQNPIVSLMPIIFIFIIFYFLLIRPQKKAQDELKKMIAALKKNDDVITTGGIHGTIVNVKDTVVTLKVDDNIKIDVEKNCIARMKRQASV
ncbi:MAG: preprotein translocase subunit YajC [Candidatus Omnitrophota bacterium]|jgi:preprotein translocase subunit YajC|nr:preprotein translocase subunit YajC [Candidatus Omnitrophota bacterium]